MPLWPILWTPLKPYVSIYHAIVPPCCAGLSTLITAHINFVWNCFERFWFCTLRRESSLFSLTLVWIAADWSISNPVGSSSVLAAMAVVEAEPGQKWRSVRLALKILGSGRHVKSIYNRIWYQEVHDLKNISITCFLQCLQFCSNLWLQNSTQARARFLGTKRKLTLISIWGSLGMANMWYLHTNRNRCSGTFLQVQAPFLTTVTM